MSQLDLPQKLLVSSLVDGAKQLVAINADIGRASTIFGID